MQWHAFQEALRSINLANKQASLPPLIIRDVEPPRILDGVRRGMDLTTLLLEFRQWSQHDPRDKVFGLLGLAKDTPIDPDYTKSLQKVGTLAREAGRRSYTHITSLCQNSPLTMNSGASFTSTLNVSKISTKEKVGSNYRRTAVITWISEHRKPRTHL